MERLSKDPAGVAEYGVIALLFAGLYALSSWNYLLFHSLAELFSIVIGCSLFVVAWNTRRIVDNHYLPFVGIAYLFISFLDMIHTLAYKGMGVFPHHGADLPTQLWIAARFLESSALLAAPLFIRRRLKAYAALGVFAAMTSLLLYTIFSGVFPDCYVEGKGLTGFKIAGEYFISLLLAGSLLSIARYRAAFEPKVFRLIALSIILTVGSELAMTLYVGVYDNSNMVGHAFKILSFYLLYKAVIATGLIEPYTLLFRNLQRREEDLRHANSELEAFTYSVSHDLRGPVSIMEGFARMTLEDFGSKMDGELRKKIEVISDSAGRMGRLIEDLLALSRVDRKEIRMRQMDMGKIARDAWREVKESCPAGEKVRLYIRDLPPATGDGSLIRQVLANLLSNACKFSGNKDIPAIEIGGYRENGRSIFFVKDNGTGFNMKYYDRLFNVFQRLHGKEFEGTGIGLAIVKRIVDRHGGRVWAQSEIDQGATFFFTLPAGQFQVSGSLAGDRGLKSAVTDILN